MAEYVPYSHLAHSKCSGNISCYFVAKVFQGSSSGLSILHQEHARMLVPGVNSRQEGIRQREKAGSFQVTVHLAPRFTELISFYS